VFEPDEEGDDILDRYAKVRIKGDELDEGKKGEIARLMEKYGDTLTKEPGLTDLAEFRIDTGSSAPIHQCPYNTPTHFHASIDTELDWLMEKQFIRPSTSPWA